MAEVAQQWKRRLGESVNKVLAVRESVGFNEGLSVGESDDEVLAVGELVGFNKVLAVGESVNEDKIGGL
jgi:hypothetical protein